MKFFLDEGAPRGIGVRLEAAGYEVIWFDEAASHSDPDTVVAAVAMENDAVLVAVDRDMRTLAKGVGVSNRRFKTLNLLHFKSKEAIALRRVDAVVPYVDLRWKLSQSVKGRRLWVEVSDTIIRIIEH